MLRCSFILVSLIVLLNGCNYFYQKPAVTTVYIQPFFPFSRERALQVAYEVGNFYKCKVVVLSERKIYSEARSASGRYSAHILLGLLAKDLKDRNGKILALTSYDIFCKKNRVNEWGVFGLGECPGRSCVVSDFRLKWFPDKTREFTINVVLHELGHTFGLPHCSYNITCLMNDAKGGIKELYREKRMLCSHCRDKIGLKI